MSEITKREHELPTLEELVSDVDTYAEHDKFNFLMNQEPPASWVKKHPYIKNHLYLPIDKIEYLLRKIIKKYRIEITGQGVAFNGVWVTVRVHYKDVVTNEWDFHDGIGSIHLQLRSQTEEEKETKTKVLFTDSNINNGALSMAFPLAKTLAVKDACDMFGKLFGADLNRRDTLGASMNTKRLTIEEKEQDIKELLDVDGLKITEEDRMNIERILDEKEAIKYNQCLKLLKSKLPK
jgi:hypothetical protein